MAGRESIRIRAGVLERMLEHARSAPNVECCGLLAGRDGVITTSFPATNALASATAYEIAPRELFQLFRTLRAQGLEHLGHYHSHLASENCPSPTDIEQAGYPEQAYFIISLLEGTRKPIRAFSIREGVVRELVVVATEGPVEHRKALTTEGTENTEEN
jgi:[CysO sulfur-carrier protein]-S-L-cysteine hydrolase